MKTAEYYSWYETLDMRPMPESYQDWVQRTALSVVPEGVSLGRFWFCELWAVWPDLAGNIHKHRPHCDPYHEDRNLNRFLNFVKDSWPQTVY